VVTLTIVGSILITIIVLGTIAGLMNEKFDSLKVTALGTILSIVVFFFLMDWEHLLEVNLGYNFENEHPHFIEAISDLVNVEAILIIFSVSIIVQLIKDSGFFDFISLYIIKLTKGNPKMLFMSIGGLTFFISMFFDNLSAIILLGSLTIVICKQLDVNPLPFVLFVGINTIIGGMPTPVSSIPNIIFFSLYPGTITFIGFTALMFPISFILFFVAYGYFYYIFKKEINKKVDRDKKSQIARINPWSSVESKIKVWKSFALLLLLFGGFLLSSVLGLDVGTIAFIVAVIGVFIFNSTLKKYVEHGVEWEMITFFVMLFTLMGIFAASGALIPLSNLILLFFDLNFSPTVAQILVVVFFIIIGIPLAGFLNNTSAALIFSYIFITISNTVSVPIFKGTWVSLILSDNVGGALTPLGSVTILMSLDILKREGIEFTFKDYFKKIFPLIIIMGIISTAYSILLVVLNI